MSNNIARDALARIPAWPPKSAPRLFVDEDLSRCQGVRIEGNQAHYLSRVMRVGEGSVVILCDDMTGEWMGEVREVVRNRAGKSTLIGRYGFDSIGGVFIDRANAPSPDVATLVLRYRNTAQTLPVVRGEVSTLEALRNRLGKDLMMDIKPRRPERTIVPTSI